MLMDDAVKSIIEKYSNTKAAIMLCGNVGCGKTTFTKKLLEFKFNPTLLAVDIDSIATMLHGGVYTRFDEKLFPLYGGIKRQVIEKVLGAGKSIVIDGTNFSADVRFQNLMYAQKYSAKSIVVDFGSGSEVALSRRMSESRGYNPEKWVDIFHIMKMSYCTPDMSEGFDEIIRVEND
jgi:predicted kinase